MMIAFAGEAWEDYQYWIEENVRFSRKIAKLIEEIRRHPFTGIGQPEALKGNLQGYWSRRINLEHRLIYKVNDELIIIKQCRYHYSK